MEIRVRFIVLTILVFTVFKSRGQEYPVIINTVTNTNNTVDLNYTKSDPGTYFLVITFDGLTNSYSSVKQKIKVGGYSGKLLTLIPANEQQGIGYSLNYAVIRGVLNPKVDSNFAYLLPYHIGKLVNVVEAGYLKAAYFGSTIPKDWKSYFLYTEKEDSVYAARKGIVVEVNDKYDSAPGNGVVFTSRKNSIIIEHADGTLADYQGFKNGSIVVKVGQTVYPSTPLGLNSQNSQGEKYTIGFMIRYLNSDKLDNEGEKRFQTEKGFYGFITPKFYVQDKGLMKLSPQQNYTVAFTQEILNKELTKKELKLSALKK